MGTYILVLLQEEKRLNPKVSICVPTYNRADSLRRCLASLIALTYPNVEIIVGDNNSTDHTQQIISQFPTVKYIQETRQGLSFVRNSLLAACSDDSKYVGFIDDDESLAPTWVQDMMQGFSDPSVAVAGGPYRNVYLGVLPDWIPEYIYPRSFQERSEIVITNVFPGIPGGNGEAVEEFQNPAEPADGYEFLRHDEADGPRTDEGKEQRVPVRDVVGDDDGVDGAEALHIRSPIPGTFPPAPRNSLPPRE